MEIHIKEAREKAGYSQKDLAKIIGVAPSTFNGYENGVHDPKSDLLIKIASICNVSVDFLLGYNPPKKSASSISEEAQLIAAAFDRANEKDKNTVRQVLAEYAISPAAVATEQVI